MKVWCASEWQKFFTSQKPDINTFYIRSVDHCYHQNLEQWFWYSIFKYKISLGSSFQPEMFLSMKGRFVKICPNNSISFRRISFAQKILWRKSRVWIELCEKDSTSPRNVGCPFSVRRSFYIQKPITLG